MKPADPTKRRCIRELVENKYLEDQLKHRTDLQQRLMRKYNEDIAWQRRVAPLRP
jgi:hypothetical protein